MPATPYAQAQASVNAGGNVTGGVTAPSAATVQLSPVSTVGWTTAPLWEIYDYPVGFATPAGWTLQASGIITNTANTPPLITLPANTVLFGKWAIRLTANTNNDPNNPNQVDTTLIVKMRSVHNINTVAYGEGSQFGGAQRQWLADLNADLRAIEANLGGGGSVPTGTGLPHITAGVQDALARDYSRGVCTPEDFGAVGGVAATDDAAFAKAMLAMAVASTITATFGGNTITRSAGSFVTDAVQVGQRIYVGTAVNAANNGPKTITAVTALTLTVSEALTTEVATVGVTINGPKTLALGQARYELLTVKTLPPLCTVRGEGDSSIVSMQSNNAIWLAGGDYSVFRDFRLIGVSVGAAQNGISTNGFSFVRISNISIGTFIGNHGIVLLNNSAANIGPVVVGCRVQNAYGTAYEVSGAQYSQLDAVQSYGCGIGIHIGAGNCLVTNGNFSLDTIGANITTGDGNDSHCIFSGCYFNHCTTHAITVGAIVNGAFFRGCNIYYSDIVLTTSTGVIFEGCTIDVTAMYFDGSTGTQFVDCTWPMANANTVNSGFNAHPSTEFWSPGNRTLTGAAVALGVNRRLDIEAAKTLDIFAGTVKRAIIDGVHGIITAGGGGSDTATHAGPLTGFETTYAALWLLLNGVARTGTNCALDSNGSDLFISSPHSLGFGKIFEYALNSVLMGTKDPVALKYTLPLQLVSTKFTATTPQAITLATGANANVAATSSTLRVSGPAGALSISGFAQPVDGSAVVLDGAELLVINTTAFAMTLTNLAVSTAANQIDTQTGADVVLPTRKSFARFTYDGTATKWILTDHS